MTIVGLEKRVSGELSLLVFDPTYRDSKTVTSLIGHETQLKPSAAEEELRAYRRGTKSLRKYREFEVL